MRVRTQALRVKLAVCALLTAAVLAEGCAGNRAPVIVAQSGLAIAQSIGQVQNTTKQLTDAKIIPPDVALRVQEGLLAVNERLKPLPDLLRTIERLQAAGDSSADAVEQAIAILQVVGQDISVVIGGVPIGETTAQLIQLIRAAQGTVQATLIEVARLRGAQ